MSDNEDLLGDDLGDQSLADYNLGNEEEEQLLADDYESGGPQNVPVSMSDGYSGAVEIVPNDYSSHGMEYAPPPIQYQPMVESECVVPNITVEVPNLPPHSYAPPARHFEPEHAVPPAILAGPMESPQIVPSEAIVMPSAEVRERFVAERPAGAQRMPQVRDIPDSLDKVVIPRGFPRGRTVWRAPHLQRFAHPYRRNNMHRGNFNQRNSFPPPQMIRPNIPQQIIRQEIRPEMIRPDIRPEMIRPDIRPEIIRPDAQDMIRPEMMRPEIEIRPEMHRDIRPDLHRPDNRPDMHREIRPEMHRDIRPDIHREMRPDMHREIRPDIHREMHREIRPDMGPIQMGPEISPERPILPDMSFRHVERAPFTPFPRYQLREERPPFGPRLHFERPGYPYPRQFNPRFGPPMRDIVPGVAPGAPGPARAPEAKEPEVRMLPLARLPPLPPAAPPPKKVLINPHFKGNFQPPVEGLPAYIPTRIQKSPPLSPTNKFGPIKDIDDAAERFIAEQRNALARAANRKFPPRRSPQRYIENTTIEIENELASRAPRRAADDDLLRRQEEFINANRAKLRRMRSPSPPSPARRSPSPRRRAEPPRAHHDEDNEYKRRLREQESLRERVLRAKEVRRRKNAVALNKQLQDRERETIDKHPPPRDVPPPGRADRPEPAHLPERTDNKPEDIKPDTTRKTPERKSPEKEIVEKPKVTKEVKEKEKRERSPIKPKDDEVNSTCEGLTPPRASPARTPPWPGAEEDDDLDMILGDIDGILSDDEDSGRFKDKPAESEPVKSRPVVDLRAKLPPKAGDKPARQKIVFHDKQEAKRKEKSPPRRAVVSSTRADDAEAGRKLMKAKKSEPKPELSTLKNRQRITFANKEKETAKEKEKDKADKTPPFSNRRVILQRKPTKDKSVFNRVESDRSQPNPGIFSRAVRIAINDKIHDKNKKQESEPQIEYDSDSDLDEDKLLNEEIGNVAVVDNLPHGMTDTRLKTLAGGDLQSLVLDKEERSAKITFKSTVAAETFKRKFNNKMVAASRLTVTLR